MANKILRIFILIPTLNAGKRWIELLNSIGIQSIEISKKIIVDSGSTDKTVALAKQNGFDVININKSDFDHGRTRQLLANNAVEADVLIYMTQDCILADKNSIEFLVNALKDEEVAISYGRQLPHFSAKLLEAHSRLFNYPSLSKVKSLDNKKLMGIKTASCSNSFAAYKREALEAAGGFPLASIFGEDVIVGGKLLIKGWKIAYVSEAKVYHSHDYTVMEEFSRFFDIGVFHKTNDWLLREFGKADGEGFKYIKSEVKTIIKNNIFLLPKMLLSTLSKFVGYKLGLNYKSLPISLTKKFSMHKNYWNSSNI